MTFKPKTFTQIFQEMRDRTPPTLTDFQEGSVVRTLYESFAFELALLYAQMDQIYLSGFVDTAQGPHLDLVVAVLGIKRGEPDFARGEVSFERDVGIDKDIEIPIGTLVTTSEDTAKYQKKAYQTIEVKTIPKDQPSALVKIQAIKRGDSEVTEAKTIQVMPQPVPGIKSVNNPQPISFTGKRRETDEELRNRAKNTLLVASGANITAIENTLLCLPGVKEVKIRENFYFARGKVTLTAPLDSGEITIPKGTKLTLIKNNKSFETTEEVTISGNNSVTVNVQALVAGSTSEVTQANLSWGEQQVEDLETNRTFNIIVSNNEPILLKDFGIIDVFVDGIDFSDLAQINRLKQEIERVRAAGIFVRLECVNPVKLDGVFQIEVDPGLSLSPEQQTKLENQVYEVITSYITEQKMGQPLLISQLTKKILEIKGINDVINFTLETRRNLEQTIKKNTYKSSETSIKRLDVEIFEKFIPGDIWIGLGN
ncbi:MAG TPA: hypothetical protein DCL61_28605 [Cyanobacteria bacterium UBA12227]|nr:hypothetical protein [Cyanobacteria bacterium UBA12227]HAX85674.1 hypothetical protein [Cyanobacteria bacterium UBA11370]HBY81816.1 hypothetical protein [Cyanobacteria bacterium UBA11148]